MTKAVCFECRKELGIGRSMEELLKDEFPVFCSIRCAGLFPIRYSKEFYAIMKTLKEEYK